MNKLSTKIILILILTLMVTSILPRVYIAFFSQGLISNVVRTNEFFIGMILTAAGSLLLFSAGINRLIIKRLKKIGSATKKVAQGDYDGNLPAKGHDEIATLTRHFNDMTETLKSNEYLHKNFVRNFSHEIKTPISSIKGYAELIEAAESNPETKEYARIIINESTRLTRLSQTMLQLSIIDSTSILKQDEPFNVAEQIRNIIQLHQHEWEQKNIEFDLHLEEFQCVLNKDWLTLLWQNLITNAIRFSKTEGVIEVTMKIVDNQIHFIITDHGLGIAEKDKENIFKLFFVADRSRNVQSSGLGLSLCKTITEKMNGRISFDSKVDEYTTFNVEIPITRT